MNVKFNVTNTIFQSSLIYTKELIRFTTFGRGNALLRINTTVRGSKKDGLKSFEFRQQLRLSLQDRGIDTLDGESQDARSYSLQMCLKTNFSAIPTHSRDEVRVGMRVKSGHGILTVVDLMEIVLETRTTRQ